MTECLDANEKDKLGESVEKDASVKSTSSSQLTRRNLFLGALLFFLVSAIFLRALQNDFIIYFDDNSYITENVQVQEGLTWETVRWAFGGINVWFYYPLTLLSHALDCQLFGLKPWGHHLTSVLIHALNTLLIFLLLKKLTATTWRSFFVAAFFGIHPFRVESVVWVTERKDVLSTFFGLLSAIFYVRYVENKTLNVRRSTLSFIIALLFFAMGLLSKPMLVTLPFAFLLLDFWPLNRLGRALPNLGLKQDPGSSDTSLYRLFFEKIPFLIFAAAASVITIIAQKGEGALSSISALPLTLRIENACICYCRYLGKTLAPLNLGLLYPFHLDPYPTWQILLCALSLLGITAFTVWRFRPQPYLAVGWFWFAGMLIPVSGIMQAGGQAMADRFTYLPSVGLFIFLIWSACDLTKCWLHQKTILLITATILMIGFASLTFQQIGYWKDSETLFRHTLAVTEKNLVMHYNLGTALSKTGGREIEALEQFEAVLSIDPNNADAHVQLGDLLGQNPAQVPESISHYEAALRLHPENTTAHAAHYSLGIASARAGRLPEAIAHFEAAVKLKPNDADTHINLGIALSKTPGRAAESQAQLEEALRLKPDSKIARQAIERLLRTQQQPGL